MKDNARLEKGRRVLHEGMKAQTRSENGKKVLHRRDESLNSIGKRKKGPSSKE
jgi:ribosomal protein L34